MTSVSFDNAAIAIKVAHERARNEILRRPQAIYRAKGVKLSRSKSDYRYTVESAWEEKPSSAGVLVMVVSVTGLERLEGPWSGKWGDASAEFVEALKG